MTAVAVNATERMRIAFVLDTEAMGGTEHYLVTLVRGLCARGVDARVILSPAAKAIGLGDAVAGAGGCAEYHAMPRDKADLVTLWGLARMLRRAAPHVVHVVLPFTLANRYAFVAARLAGCRTVVSTEQLAAEPWVFRRGRARAVKQALAAFQACIIASSEDVRRRLIDDAKLPSAKIVTIYNGIDIPRLPADGERARVRAELGLAPCTPLVGMVARIDFGQKRHDDFLAAARQIAAGVPDAHFLIVGDGKERERRALECLADRLGLTPRVHFLGHRTDAGRLIGALDAFVLATTNEGFPFVTLEAMALAVPVVATDLPALREQIAHGTSGWLVVPGQPGGLADAVLRVLADPATARGVAARGRETVVERFGVEEMTARTDALYRWALADRRAGGGRSPAAPGAARRSRATP